MFMNTPKPSPQMIDYVNRSFRDVADGDYILARMAYRIDLPLQFLCCAEQAIEKYLKAILLYNGRRVKDISHEPVKAFDRLFELPDIPFDFPNWTREFISYLENYGPNRYFERDYYLMGRELAALDRTVWEIRRYCYYLRGEIRREGRSTVELFPPQLRRLKDQTPERAHEARISGGYLEKVLASRGSGLRAILVWKNPYFGIRFRKVIRAYPVRMMAANSAVVMDPRLYEELRERVKFSKRFSRSIEERIRTEFSAGSS